MADLVFARQRRRGGPDPEGLAYRLSLDLNAFRACMASPSSARLIRRDVDEGNAKRLSGTPACFLNGRRLSTWPTASTIKRAIEATKKRDRPAGPKTRNARP